MNLKQYFENILNKKMIIMRGAPGSGKSYTAKQLGSNIFSTDNEFMVNGEYKFDASKFGLYHANTQNKVKEACEQGITPIIIDNTNITLGQMKPYVQMAEQYGYEIEFKESSAPWWTMKPGMSEDDKGHLADILAEKNEHGVPKEGIQKMLNNWKHYDPKKHEEFISQIKQSEGY